MAAPLNKIATDYDIDDLNNLLMKQIMLSLNCHAIATIKSFDSVKRTVSAKIIYNKTFYKSEADGTRNPYYVEYPILLDCPVIILGGGASSLTFPISAGDTCLMLFNDRDIDNWVAGANSGPPATGRLHSLSDGIALVGFITPSAYDTNRAVLRNGPTYVGVSSTKVKIANGNTTLNAVLQDLVTAIKNIITTNCVLGAPVTLSPASMTAMTAMATEIGGLLE